MSENFALKGNICYSKSLTEINTVENGYLICENGLSAGVFTELPEQYQNLTLIDCGDNLVIPGLCDLHVHAPQFSFRGLGMDLELLEWLNVNTFPEEAKYEDLDYAEKAYSAFVNDVKGGPNTRLCVFGTVHPEATELLMEKLEASGLVSMVGKVNMDRNCPDILRENDARSSYDATLRWLDACVGKYKNTSPILTPRFIPSCTDELMRYLKQAQGAYNLPIQSHLSENPGEIAWVSQLCPEAASYADAYEQYGLFGGHGMPPAVMAHCVWVTDDEISLIKDNGVFIAHCPQSNTNISSGIAPVRKFLQNGLNVGLGSDVAGGCHTSIFRAISDAVQVSKLRWRLVDQTDAPLTVREAFYLATVGGGSFFGKVGSFEPGYELDALVISDENLSAPFKLSLEDRLVRIIYLSDDRNILAKFSRGARII